MLGEGKVTVQKGLRKTSKANQQQPNKEQNKSNIRTSKNKQRPLLQSKATLLNKNRSNISPITAKLTPETKNSGRSSL
jgi:hypothetical protein